MASRVYRPLHSLISLLHVMKSLLPEYLPEDSIMSPAIGVIFATSRERAELLPEDLHGSKLTVPLREFKLSLPAKTLV